jgi:acyl-CoA reductase-like NAD-dependent aldehyde dehydrogenase
MFPCGCRRILRRDTPETTVQTRSLPTGGERGAARSGRTFDRLDPLDGSVATRAPAADIGDAQAAAAAPAFPAWPASGPGQRRALLPMAAHALEARGPAFTDLRPVTAQTPPRRHPF